MTLRSRVKPALSCQKNQLHKHLSTDQCFEVSLALLLETKESFVTLLYRSTMVVSIPNDVSESPKSLPSRLPQTHAYRTKLIFH